MKHQIERVLLVSVLILGLSWAWLGTLDNSAATVVDAGLKRALLSFASARAMNSVISVIQSASISGSLIVGASLTIGQFVQPINQLVGEFAELMLAASVAFGIMKFLIVIGSYKGVSLLLSIVALWWGWLCWQQKPVPSWVSKVLLVILLVRFAVPVVSVGSDLVFNELLKERYTTAQQGITFDENWIATTTDWVKSPTQIPDRVRDFKQSVERWIAHMVDLIVLFLIQTLVLPLIFMWLLYRVFSAILTTRRQSSMN